jgi:hypothetical protein
MGGQLGKSLKLCCTSSDLAATKKEILRIFNSWGEDRSDYLATQLASNKVLSVLLDQNSISMDKDLEGTLYELNARQAKVMLHVLHKVDEIRKAELHQDEGSLREHSV